MCINDPMRTITCVLSLNYRHVAGNPGRFVDTRLVPLIGRNASRDRTHRLIRISNQEIVYYHNDRSKYYVGHTTYNCG